MRAFEALLTVEKVAFYIYMPVPSWVPVDDDKKLCGF